MCDAPPSARRQNRAPMKTVLLLLALVCCGLMAGTTFAFWLLGNPARLSYPTFIEYFPAMVRAVRGPLTVLGFSCVLSVAASTVLAWSDGPRFYVVAAALVLCITAWLVTTFGNVPINEQVLAWDSHTAPVDWVRIMSRWWHWHLTRFAAVTGAFGLLAVSVLRWKAA